jgi:hypothetical protein
MKKLLVGIISVSSFFISYHFVLAVDISNTGSLDYIDTDALTSYTFGVTAGSIGNEEVGWGYLPGASHNICNIKTIMASSSNPTDAVNLQIRLGTTTVAGGHFTTQGVLAQSNDADIQVRGPLAVYTYTFTPCVVVVGGNWYAFILNRDGSLNATNKYQIQGAGVTSTIGGTAKWTYLRYDAFSSTGIISTLPALAFDIVVNGTENFSAVTPITNATTTSYGSASCFGSTFSLADIACYLFIPSQDVINEFTNLSADTLQNKVPFNYFYDFINDFNNLSIIADASTSPTISIAFSGMTCTGAWNGTGSTTCTNAQKDWLPDLTFFSKQIADNTLTSTMIYYLRYIIELGLYFIFGLGWYFRIKNFWFGQRNTV